MFSKEGSSLQTSQQTRAGAGGNKKKAQDTPLRKSDRRKLRSRFLSSFVATHGHHNQDALPTTESAPPLPHLEAWTDEIFQNGGCEILQRRIKQPGVTSNKGSTVLYLRTPSPPPTSSPSSSSEFRCHWPYTATQPILIELPSSSPSSPSSTSFTTLVPTVALLSVLPRSLFTNTDNGQTVLIHPSVSRYLCRGADLMRSGMLSCPSSPLLRPIPPLDPFSKNNKGGVKQSNTNHTQFWVAIRATTNPQPFAIGLLTSGTTHDTIGPETRGVGVRIVTCYGDDLYRQTLRFAEGDGVRCRLVEPYEGIGNREDINDEMGDYGNRGFVEGKMVYGLMQQSMMVMDVTDSEDEEAVEDNFQKQTNDERGVVVDGGGGVGGGVVGNPPNNGSSVQIPKSEDDGDPQSGTNTDGCHGVTELSLHDAAAAADSITTQPTEKSQTNTTDDSDSDSDNESNDSDTSDRSESKQPTTNNDPQISTTNTNTTNTTPEQTLYQAFYNSILTLSPKRDLPLPVSTYYTQHLLPSRQTGSTIDLKSTRFKKLSVFLTHMAQRGLITLAPSSDSKDPVAFLTGVDRNHIDLREAKELRRKRNSHLSSSHGNTDGSTNQPPNHHQSKPKRSRLVIANLFRIPTDIAKLFRLDPNEVSAINAKSEERRGTGYLTLSECRILLDRYVEEEGLVDEWDPEMVHLDGPICNGLFRKKLQKEQQGTGRKNVVPIEYPQQVTRKELAERWMETMEKGYALVEMPGSRILSMKRGKPPSILIEVETRQNRKKFLTRIRGLEEYNINAAKFANDVSKRFACSASIDDNPAGRAALKKGCVEISFQGNLGEYLRTLLTGDEKGGGSQQHGGTKGGEYFVPKGVIEVVLKKGVGKKR